MKEILLTIVISLLALPYASLIQLFYNKPRFIRDESFEKGLYWQKITLWFQMIVCCLIAIYLTEIFG